jgi:hypothetical protein
VLHRWELCRRLWNEVGLQAVFSARPTGPAAVFFLYSTATGPQGFLLSRLIPERRAAAAASASAGAATAAPSPTQSQRVSRALHGATAWRRTSGSIAPSPCLLQRAARPPAPARRRRGANGPPPDPAIPLVPPPSLLLLASGSIHLVWLWCCVAMMLACCNAACPTC